MSHIQISNLSFTHDGAREPLFQSLNFQMDSSWKLGLVGRNGRGKTTLLQLLLGKYPHEGSIVSSLPFAYFPYPVEKPDTPALELLESLCPRAESWQCLRELSLLDIEERVLEMPFKTLSNGEQTKLLLAALFLGETRFLLIDEPTNHLDLEARETLANYLRRKEGFILVSHDRSLLDTCTDHTLAITPTGIDVQHGSYSVWRENKDRQEQFEETQQNKLRHEVTKLSASAARTSQWSDKVEQSKKGSKNSGLRPDRGYIGHKSAKMMKRSKSLDNRRQKALEDAKALLQDAESRDSLKLHPLTHHAKSLLSLQNLTISYGDSPLFSPLSLRFESGQRLALRGKNGSGKSSLLKLLLGEDIPHRGQLTLASGLIISYVPQSSHHLKGNLDDHAKLCQIDNTLFKTILRKLGFSREQFEKGIAHYSDGQKKKVLLAASLCQSAHLYIWDEPLNFIDLPSRLQIEALILAYEPSLIMVEHDKAFCDTVATDIIALSK